MIRRFEPPDLEAVNGWAGGHSLPPLALELVPEHGWIVPGVACGFLYRSELPALATLDSFISNPDATPEARHHAWEAIFDALEAAVVRLGITDVIAYTSDGGIERRARGRGFQILGACWRMRRTSCPG